MPPDKLISYPAESLADAEQETLNMLDKELGPHGRLNMQAFNIVGKILSHLPGENIKDIPISQKVCTSLLVQLSNDLRSASLIALRGYAVQALTIVSSMFETAYCITAIGNDEPLAQKWVNHDDPTKSFLHVKNMVEMGLKKIDHPSPKKQTEIEYRVYRQLCMAKHANPIFQIEHGFIIKGQRVVAMNGPNTSENTVRAAWFAMEHATALTYIALVSFLKHHIPFPQNHELLGLVLAIGEARKNLESQAIKRWGTEDPFKGKW